MPHKGKIGHPAKKKNVPRHHIIFSLYSLGLGCACRRSFRSIVRSLPWPEKRQKLTKVNTQHNTHTKNTKNALPTTDRYARLGAAIRYKTEQTLKLAITCTRRRGQKVKDERQRGKKQSTLSLCLSLAVLLEESVLPHTLLRGISHVV